MKKILLSSLILFSSSSYLFADEFSDLLNEIETTTKIATKNNVETTYAPGIITILTNEELKRQGIKNFYEALKLIPSVDIGLSSTGTKNIITRGVGGITGSGKTKIMINGVGQNSNASGIIHFNLPIDIIERIEVIRGPASALYGEYAFSGVINIVTKKNTNSIFYIKDSTSNLVGATLNYNNKDLKIDASIITDDDNGIEPNNIETLREEKDFIANISYKDFNAKISLNRAKKGEFYGLLSTFPQKDDEENFIYDYQTVELSNKFTLNSNLSIEPKVGILNYNYIMDNVSIPFRKLNTDVKYKKSYFMLDSIYKIKNHEIVSGIEYSTTKKVDDSTNKKDTTSFYLHDNINLNDTLDLSVGARYEKYFDILNSKLTNSTLPRIAFVYRYNPQNTFKLQYGEAYRPPTFIEERNGPIDAETIDTYEFQHIYKSGKNKIQTTIFHSIIENLINSNWLNETEDIISQGVEVELLHNFNNDFLLNSNISYNNAYYNESKVDIGKYSKILGNVSLSYLPYSKFSSTLYFRYIGSKERERLDTRDKVKAQYYTDIAFKYLPNKNNIEITFGIKNIFNKDIIVPSSINTIPDDILYQQRNYYVGINYRF